MRKKKIDDEKWEEVKFFFRYLDVWVGTIKKKIKNKKWNKNKNKIKKRLWYKIK